MALSVHTSEKFALLIERRVKQGNISYMDAILEFCERRGVEPESIIPLVNDKMKMLIGEEAQRLNLIPKTKSLF